MSVMQLLIISGQLLLLAFNAPFQDQQAQKVEILKIEPERLEFGRVFDGDEPVKKITVRNVSDKAITIKRLGKTCGCAVSKIVLSNGEEVVITERTAFKPICILERGDFVEIHVTFRTWGYKGELNKTISLETDYVGLGVKVVKIHAIIVESVKLTPEIVDLGEVIRGQQRKVGVKIQSLGIGEYDITGIKNIPSYLAFTSKKITEGEKAEYYVEFETREDPPLGNSYHHLQVNVKNKNIKVVRIPLKLKVIPKVCYQLKDEIIDDELDIGVFSRDKGKTLEVDIVNLASSIPYKPISVESEASDDVKTALDISLETEKEGELYKLLINIKPGISGTGFLRAKIMIKSLHPDCLLKTVHILGWPQ